MRRVREKFVVRTFDGPYPAPLISWQHIILDHNIKAYACKRPSTVPGPRKIIYITPILLSAFRLSHITTIVYNDSDPTNIT